MAVDGYCDARYGACMVSYEVLGLIVIGSLIVVGGLVAGVVYVGRAVRGASLSRDRQPMSETGAPVPSDIDASVLRAIGERLVLLESRLPALQQTLDGYAAVSGRIADLEGRLPVLADAYDKFSQVTLNADKRRIMQEQRADKKAADNEELSVGEAAAQMGLAGEAPKGNSKPADDRPAGVLGAGGNPVRRR